MANLVYEYYDAASKLVWADSAQSPDSTLTFASLAAGAVRYGGRDYLENTKSRWWYWRCVIRMETAGVVGQSVDIYLSTSDGTDEDGNIGTSDAAGSTDKLNNLIYVGSVVVDTTATNTDIISSGFVKIDANYCSVVIHNNTADALHSSTSAQHISLTPVPDHIQ